jgi:predicted transposase YbfD/YdcC
MMSVDDGAVYESVVFLEYFADLPDPRQLIKVIYPLDEVLLLSLLAVLAGAETFTDIARFGENKLALLRRFAPFANNTPPHDRLGEIFAALDAECFQRCFVAWVAARTGISAEVIAIDGKTSRRSFAKKGVDAPIHIVSAFAARQRLVLGQVKVAEKSNEIIAIPKLLDLLVIEGATITIDAMGCQRDIAAKIIDKKGDYLLALKGNQGTLRDDVELFFNEQKTNGFNETTTSQHQSVDGDHGRIDTRTTTVIHDINWLNERHNWPGLKAIVMVQSQREIDKEIEIGTRFYITSSTDTAPKIAAMVQNHWAIENSLHWVMDMVFRDDECRISTGHAPANFTTIKHIALNLMRRSPAKDSLRLKRKVAAWDDNYLISLITA